MSKYPNRYAFRPASDKYLVDLLLGTDFAYTGDDKMKSYIM